MENKRNCFWQTLYTLCAVFLFGAVIGWTYELLLRRITGDAWVNPGMLFGPYLPIYGFGAATLFGLAYVPIPVKNKFWKGAAQLLLTGIILTAVEYIGGLIFVRWMGLDLWSYEQFSYNVQGIICPLCSLGWALAGGVYLWFLHPLVLRLQKHVLSAQTARFLLAFAIGAVCADFLITIFL